MSLKIYNTIVWTLFLGGMVFLTAGGIDYFQGQSWTRRMYRNSLRVSWLLVSGTVMSLAALLAFTATRDDFITLGLQWTYLLVAACIGIWAAVSYSDHWMSSERSGKKIAMSIVIGNVALMAVTLYTSPIVLWGYRQIDWAVLFIGTCGLIIACVFCVLLPYWRRQELSKWVRWTFPMMSIVLVTIGSVGGSWI